MSNISIRKFQTADQEKLFDILSNTEWPYHSGDKLTRDAFNQRIANNFYTRQGILTFLIEEKNRAIGYVRIFDLGDNDQSDETPLFDIRLSSSEQKKGYASQALKQIVDYIFNHYPNKNRIEATTRNDNKAMRRVLEKCLFVKEAHYRKGWSGQEGKDYDAIGYGILRQD